MHPEFRQSMEELAARILAGIGPAAVRHASLIVLTFGLGLFSLLTASSGRAELRIRFYGRAELRLRQGIYGRAELRLRIQTGGPALCFRKSRFKSGGQFQVGYSCQELP